MPVVLEDLGVALGVLGDLKICRKCVATSIKVFTKGIFLTANFITSALAKQTMQILINMEGHYPR